MTKAFTPRRVAAMAPTIERVASELLDAIAARPADIVARFAWPLPLTVVGDMLGVPRDDLGRLHEWSVHWLRLKQPATLEQQLEWAESTVALQRYFMELLDRRERDPGDDLTSALLAAAREVDPPWTRDAVMGVPLDLVVAGHVTVTRAIGNALVLLLGERARADELRADVASCRGPWRRSSGSSPLRKACSASRRGGPLGGVTLPEGARLMVHYGSANRDEDVFACPAHYDPRREGLNRHVAFGKGVHFCIGAPLARPSSASRSRCCSSGCRGSGSPAGRSGGSPSSSLGAWSGSTSNGILRDDPGHSDTTGGHNMVRRRSPIVLAAAVALVAALVGATAGTAARMRRRSASTTRPRSWNFGRDAYVYVAMEKGYFEQAGFDVHVTPGTGVGRQHQARGGRAGSTTRPSTSARSW